MFYGHFPTLPFSAFSVHCCLNVDIFTIICRELEEGAAFAGLAKCRDAVITMEGSDEAIQGLATPMDFESKDPEVRWFD